MLYWLGPSLSEFWFQPAEGHRIVRRAKLGLIGRQIDLVNQRLFPLPQPFTRCGQSSLLIHSRQSRFLPE